MRLSYDLRVILGVELVKASLLGALLAPHLHHLECDLGVAYCCPAGASDTQMRIKNLEAALVHYQVENDDACPLSLDTLVKEKILAKPVLDAWGRPFAYRCPGEHNPDGADFWSAGRDGIFGTADDITSW